MGTTNIQLLRSPSTGRNTIIMMDERFIIFIIDIFFLIDNILMESWGWKMSKQTLSEFDSLFRWSTFSRTEEWQGLELECGLTLIKKSFLTKLWNSLFKILSSYLYYFAAWHLTVGTDVPTVKFSSWGHFGIEFIYLLTSLWCRRLINTLQMLRLPLYTVGNIILKY